MDESHPGALVRLPHIDDIELPSIMLLERAYQRSMNGHMSRREMFKIWNRLGCAVASTLLQGKGVRFPGIMDLSFDQRGRPMYELERDMNVVLKQFGSGHSVKWKKGHDFIAGARLIRAPVLATLPLQTVADSLNAKHSKKHAAAVAAAKRRGDPPPVDRKKPLDRNVIGLVVHRVFSELIRAARTQTRSIALTLDDVGEFIYTAAADGDGVGARGHLVVRFRLDFVHALVKTQARQAIEAPKHRRVLANMEDRITTAEFLDPTIVTGHKLLAAPGLNAGGEFKRAGESLEGLDCVRRIKFRLTERCGLIGLHTFLKALSTFDESGDGAFDAEELRWGLREFGISVSEDETLSLIRMFDADGGGTLSLAELMVALRDETMSERRVMMVKRVFHALCRDAGVDAGEDAVVPIASLRARFNAFGDERVQRGDPNWPPRDVTNNFFAVLDDGGDGEVSAAEFRALYENVSPAIDDDAAFEGVLQQFWPALGGTDGKGNSRASRGARGAGYVKNEDRDLRAADKDSYLDDVLDMADASRDATAEARLDAILDRGLPRRGGGESEAREVLRGQPRKQPPPAAKQPPKPRDHCLFSNRALDDRGTRAVEPRKQGGVERDPITGREIAPRSRAPPARDAAARDGFGIDPITGREVAASSAGTHHRRSPFAHHADNSTATVAEAFQRASAKPSVPGLSTAVGAATAAMAGANLKARAKAARVRIAAPPKTVSGPGGVRIAAPKANRRQSGWGEGDFDSFQKNHRRLG